MHSFKVIWNDQHMFMRQLTGIPVLNVSVFIVKSKRMFLMLSYSWSLYVYYRIQNLSKSLSILEFDL